MRALTRGWYVGLVAAMAACDITDVQAPALVLDEEVGAPFVEEIDGAGLETILAAGPAELEIVLLDDGVTAGDVAVRTNALSGSESIQSRVTSLDETSDRLVLALGAIGVTLHQTTRFWVGDEAVSRETLMRLVREDVAAGRQTPVVVERAAVESQDPQDTTFVALDVMVGGDGTASLRMKAGSDNVHRVSNPSAGEPDVWVKWLGRQLRLHLRDGRTHVMRHHHHYPRVVAFGGTVESIDLDTRTLELEDGTRLRVTGRTDFVRLHGHARNLRAAAEALENGLRVKARGLGVTERGGGVLALRVALKLEQVEHEPVIVDFEGVVVDVRPDAVGTLVELANGTMVRVRTTTELVAVDEHSPSSLGELEQALEDGREVVARGRGEVEGEQPLVLDGLRVELQGEAPPPEEELESFVGIVDYVSFDASIVLTDGTVVVLPSTTPVSGADANSPATIDELMTALDRNRRVELRGEGRFDGELQVTAAQVVLAALVGTFDVDVRAIDPDTGGLILSNGSFALLTESTVVTAVNGGPTDLGGVDAAIGSGDRVRARGSGFLRGRATEPGRLDSYEVIAVEFEVMP